MHYLKGGSVSALCASLGSALACMSALLTYGNKKFEALDDQIREVLPRLYDSYQELVNLVDEDAKAFTSYVVT
jgi:formiminotetrahydrofolate cyclodeaminase